MGNIRILCVIYFLVLLMGCSADYHSGKVQKGLQGENLTVGTVQREIKIGMSSSSV